jgi:uncharacterized protein YegP (UPF0339 family)
MIKFEIYQSPIDRLWRWRLWAANNRIVCWSEGYSSKQEAQRSVNWVKAYANAAPVIQPSIYSGRI